MARNGSGTMSVVNTFSTGNPILASGHNQNNTDIANEITNSLALDGQSVMTGQTKNASGSAAAPSITFGPDLDTGFYRRAANSIGMALDGTSMVEWATATASIGMALVVTGALTTGGALAASATAEITGVAVLHGGVMASATAAFSGLVTMSSTSHMKIPSGTTAQRPGSPAVANVRFNTDLSCPEAYNGAGWVLIGKAPTYQYLTASASATYTTPTGALRLVVRLVGGGGAAAAGSNGGTSNFGATTAGGGTAGGGTSGATPGNGGAGGTGGTTGLGTQIARFVGGAGGQGIGNSTAAVTITVPGGMGGGTPFGAGPGSDIAAGAGSGAGASATQSSITNNQSTAGGGGGGEYVEFQVTNPAGTYDYKCGNAGGTRAAAGSIIVAEYYN